MTIRLAAALLATLIMAGCATEPMKRTALKQLYTPHYAPPPPAEPAVVSLGKLPARFMADQRAAARSSALTNQAAVLVIALAVMLAAAFDFRHPRNPRNVDLVLMQALGWSFYNVLGFLDRLHDPTTRNYMDWVFTIIVVLTVTLMVRAIRRVSRPAPGQWTPRLNVRVMAPLALLLLALDVGVALARAPDDAGYFVNIGGQRLRERLKLPYGDPLLTATPAAAYGPLLYLAHVPFQVALAPGGVNAESPDRPPIESADVYFEPPILATKLAAVAFHLLAVLALWLSARRLRSSAAAWAVVALYCGSAFVLGMGGGEYSIGGITFVSHVAPAAVTLLAFALLDRPAWSGAALAAAIGVLFYPVFMVPAWLGYYWRDRGRLKPFVVGLAAASLVIGGSVLLLSQPAGGRGLVGTIVYDTIGHQESPEAYGSSPFGFWGQRAGVRGWLMTPLAANQSMTRPVVLAFFVFAAGMFSVARGRTPQQFALIIAAVAMGAELWKIHATATYVTWYYPFLLLGVLCDGHSADARAVRATPAETGSDRLVTAVEA
jgi:hypothetical protein